MSPFICGRIVDDRARCIICDDAKVVRGSTTLAGAERRFCLRCAQLGAAVASAGALAQVAHCLHLVGCEFERFEPLRPDDPWPVKDWFGRLAVRLQGGDLRAACQCGACSGRPFVGPVDDLHRRFEVVVEQAAEALPWAMLKALPENQVLITRDMQPVTVLEEKRRRRLQNYDETEQPGPVLGSLSSRARPFVAGRWIHEVDPVTGYKLDIFTDIDMDDGAALREAQSIAFWKQEAEKPCRWRKRDYDRARAQFGGGYRDGNYWVDPDGVCHEWVKP